MYIPKKELINALEKARNRLVIAIAEESKSTPRNQRQYYLNTADLVRNQITGLRMEKGNGNSQFKEWILAIEELRNIPLQHGARGLCESLRRIIAALE